MAIVVGFPTDMDVAAVDLFCGAGGLTLGLEEADVDVRAAVDLDPACEHPVTANTSAEFVLGDVAALEGERVACWLENATWTCLVGCAPCQPFSTYTQGRDRDEAVQDGRWNLITSFLRLVEEVKPTIVSMENVPNLRRTEVFKGFTEGLENLGYEVSTRVVDCVEYGVPQRRHRLVLLASSLGPIKLVAPTHCGRARTVRNTISGLERLEAGATSAGDPLHTCAGLSETNLERIRRSMPGGTWRDWPPDLVLKCHARASGAKYPSVYGRMEWDCPAPTMTTNCFNYGSGRFGHPDTGQDRAISLREAALLQTFPPEFRFTGEGEPVHFGTVGRLIGDAVPPRLGTIIGRSILKHLARYGAGTAAGGQA